MSSPKRKHFVASVAVFAVVGAHLVDNYSRAVNTDAAFLLKAHDGAQGSFGARHGEKEGSATERMRSLTAQPIADRVPRNGGQSIRMTS